MPLKISWSFDPGDNKSRSKMYRQGHYAKVRRPTGPELYEDASRILDELLQKQLNDQLKSHGRPPRYKTHPLSTRRPVTSGEVLDERDEAGLEDGIERCKTMPSRMRGSSKDEPLLPKDLEALRKKANKQNHMIGELSDSSADTEGDSASVAENRKKKGLFQRAKDRLIHSFHRQEREKENKLKENDSPKVSPKKQARKTPRKKPADEVNGVKVKGGKNRAAGDNKESVPSPQNEGYSKRRNSAGKALLNSIRKSFKSKKDERRFMQDEAGGEKRPSPASSSGTSRPSPEQELAPPDPRRGSHYRYVPPPPSAPHAPTGASHDAAPLPHAGGPARDGRLPSPSPPPPGSSLTVPGTDRKGSSQSHSAHEHSVSPYPHSSSTDSHLGDGSNMSSSVHSFSSKHSVPNGRNMLDDPGDDIEYMDMAEERGAVQNGGIERTVGDGSKGGGVGKGSSLSSDHRTRHPYKQQSSLCVDGDSDTQDGKGRPPDNADDIPFHERTEEEKKEMYGKIAQKLKDMANTYAAESGVSDGESHHKEAAAAAPALGPEGLTELEQQILECLRNVGDRNSQVMENQAEEFIQQTKAETYERFKSTVQQSLGYDISWNHLALLFYTTKSVVSAVGIGSKMASDAKEMTLRYFSDKFAKWLMDQGGFDSVLSESDSELD